MKGQMVMDGGQLFVANQAAPTGVPQTSADYTLIGPPSGSGGGNTGPQTVNFDTGATAVPLAVAAGGAAGVASYIDSGKAVAGTNTLGTKFTLPAGSDTASVKVTTNGTIDSYSANFTASTSAAVSADPVTVKSQLYYAPPGSDEFSPVPSSLFDMSPNVTSLTLGQKMSGSASGLNFPVEEGGRLILAYATQGGANTTAGTLPGTGNGTLEIK